MSWELLGLAIVFAFVIAGTPGPANLSLMALGASVGFRRSRRYLFGIWAGGLLVTVIAGLGLGAALQEDPILYHSAQMVGLCYIAFLAWRLATMQPGDTADDDSETPSFWAGSALHPVNPKAYVMNVTAFASFIAPGLPYGTQAVVIGAALFVVMVICTTVWTLGGDLLRHMLTQARYAQALRIGLAVAMVVSVGAPVLLS